MKQEIEARLRKRFVARHGEGEAHQADVYRCQTCGRLITWNRIRNLNLCCQGRMFPTNPTRLEMVRLFLLPWTV